MLARRRSLRRNKRLCRRKNLKRLKKQRNRLMSRWLKNPRRSLRKKLHPTQMEVTKSSAVVPTMPMKRKKRKMVKPKRKKLSSL